MCHLFHQPDSYFLGLIIPEYRIKLKHALNILSSHITGSIDLIDHLSKNKIELESERKKWV